MEQLIQIVQNHLTKQVLDQPGGSFAVAELRGACNEAREWMHGVNAQLRQLTERIEALRDDKRDAGQLETNTLLRLGHLESTGTVLRQKVHQLELTFKALGMQLAAPAAPQAQGTVGAAPAASPQSGGDDGR